MHSIYRVIQGHRFCERDQGSLHRDIRLQWFALTDETDHKTYLDKTCTYTLHLQETCTYTDTLHLTRDVYVHGHVTILTDEFLPVC